MNNRIRMKDLFFDGHMEGLSEKDGKNILEIKKRADRYSVCAHAHAGIYEKREHQRQAN